MASQRETDADALMRRIESDPSLVRSLAEVSALRLSALARHYNEVIDRITDEILKRNEHQHSTNPTADN